eukprot:GHRQ01016461.1.p1 GENE.GHRQ01016461.1~~GHRQ01016461.1.p1  ORF type:complete len:346 (+),score=118.89 GHRQ01016461.1:97-1134(+)
MSVSAIFILDVKGRVLIHRDYRGDVSTKFADKFMSKLNESEDSGKLSPILHDDGVTYIYLQHSNVYLLAVTRQNVNATAVVVFLHRLVDVFKHYFEEVEEESIRDNFVTVYELMDEVMDYGYPQFTEAPILQEFIKTDSYRMEQTAVKPPMAVTNAVSWRSEGIRHKKNEVFLDVVESVNLLVNSNGNVVLSEVTGVLKMRAYLSGMPECKLGLNDKVSSSRVSVHAAAAATKQQEYHQPPHTPRRSCSIAAEHSNGIPADRNRTSCRSLVVVKTVVVCRVPQTSQPSQLMQACVAASGGVTCLTLSTPATHTSENMLPRHEYVHALPINQQAALLATVHTPGVV